MKLFFTFRKLICSQPNLQKISEKFGFSGHQSIKLANYVDNRNFNLRKIVDLVKKSLND